jgi:hypothetical protein
MKSVTMMWILIFGLVLTACGDGSTTQPEQDAGDLSTEQQAELVAAALSENQGGIGEDIATVSRAASGNLEQSAQAPGDPHGYTVSVTVDFFDADGNLQQAYDPDTTDRIDYQSLVQGHITNGVGFFRELQIDNQSDFTVEDILSQYVWINGSHTNYSSYSRTQPLTNADVRFQLDSELTLTDVAVDLKAPDSFPESGTTEGSLSGSYERTTPNREQQHEFNFHFIATYMGDNTAEVEFDDGTVFIVHLDSGSVQYEE